MSDATRVLHVIIGLKVGGAERMLATVARALTPLNVESCVACVLPGGPVAETLRADGIRVFELGRNDLWSLLAAPLRLRRLIQQLSPHVVQGWMYHGNALAALATPRGTQVAFNVRHSLPDLGAEKPLTRWVIRLGAALSRRAAAIIYNSERARGEHESLGYVGRHALALPNGFDTTAFTPSPHLRAACREQLGIGADEFVVGTVGRYHPVKNQRMFLEAAAMVVANGERARFVLAGRGIPAASAGLVQYATSLGIANRVIFLDEFRDVPRLMNALDVLCLTSNSEGFPNVIGEAMSCGVPVISTDVGDVAHLLGERRRLVPVGDAAALAAKLTAELRNPVEARDAASKQARQRIEEVFSERRMIDAYYALYSSLRDST